MIQTKHNRRYSKYLDADECTNATHNCHEHATCTDIVGSYTCQCEVGYTGDGFNCEGMNVSEEWLRSCQFAIKVYSIVNFT